MAKTPRAMFLALSMGVILLGGLTDANAAPKSGLRVWKSRNIEVRNETGWTEVDEIVAAISDATAVNLRLTHSPPVDDGCHPIEGLIRICFRSMGPTGPTAKTEPLHSRGDIAGDAVGINSDQNPWMWTAAQRRWTGGHEVLTHSIMEAAHLCGAWASLRNVCSDGLHPLPQTPDQSDIDTVNAAYGAVKALSQP